MWTYQKKYQLQASRNLDVFTSGGPRFKVRLGPGGMHLFDRRTGLNVLCDEVVVPVRLGSLARCF
ncbi:MAG: hypothetical protein ACRD1T_15785 [Acidimicrobiia bacterium]